MKRQSKDINIEISDISFVEGLKYDLLSISQFCGTGHIVEFLKNKCLVIDANIKEIKFIGTRKENIYAANWKSVVDQKAIYYMARNQVESDRRITS